MGICFCPLKAGLGYNLTKLASYHYTSNNSQMVNIYNNYCSYYFNFNWMIDITWEMIDSFYQLNEHAAYQLDQWSVVEHNSVEAKLRPRTASYREPHPCRSSSNTACKGGFNLGKQYRHR